MHIKRASLLLPLALAACGTLPQPFYGNPGPVAARLAIPPAPVLMVPTPGNALLGREAALLYAKDLAAELADFDVPSVAGPAQRGLWQLAITAQSQGGGVIPAYEVIGPDGKSYGRENGAAVPAQSWTQGDQSALAGAASSDAASLSKLMSQINAQIQQSNPQSLENRTPRIFILGLDGAPGDGDKSLPLNLSRDLPGPDLQLAKDKAQADFTVAGKVKTSPGPGGQILVEIDWVVCDTNNRVTGQVTQLHALDASDMEPNWGDVAAAAAQEAASGIQNVVQNAVLKKAKKP